MELPRLKPLYERLRDRGLEIVVIDRARDTDDALKFIRENSLPYKFVENGEGHQEVVVALFGVRSFPTSFLVDRNGKIVRVHVGYDEGDEREYEAQILQLLNEKPTH